jgi:hypothetical protein
MIIITNGEIEQIIGDEPVDYVVIDADIVGEGEEVDLVEVAKRDKTAIVPIECRGPLTIDKGRVNKDIVKRMWKVI